MSDPHPLDPLIRKLRARSPLDEADAAVLRAIPFQERTLEAPGYLVREGSTEINRCALIQSGFAFRQKLTADGARQIVSVHVPGDLLDLQQLFLRVSDHSVQALTRLHVAELDRDRLRELATSSPAISRALWIDALVEASISREWVLNVGRRDGRERIAHLLCEFVTRLRIAGLGSADGSFDLPMTQEQIADAVGMTGVHVNRILRAMVKDGHIAVDKRRITSTDWRRIGKMGDFSALYLHLDRSDGADGGFAFG